MLSFRHLATRNCITGNGTSGFALQDIVNEIGRRLGFTIVNGRYRGKRNEPGYDGLWKLPNGHTLIIEVKTTDAYRINVEDIVKYQKGPRETDPSIDDLSFLYVVGRQDTGGLEQQIRGSRHAWDIRIISTKSLLSLLELKESLGDPNLLSKITRILIPQEFTRLDAIIDLVFSTADDISDTTEKSDDQDDIEINTDAASIGVGVSDFHSACSKRIGSKLNIRMQKITRTIYESEDKKHVVCVFVSKMYDKYVGKSRYWFSLRPYHIEALKDASNGYVAFGCDSSDLIFLIPYTYLNMHIPHFRTTPKGDKTYYHVDIFGQEGKFRLGCPKAICKDSDITKFRI